MPKISENSLPTKRPRRVSVETFHDAHRPELHHKISLANDAIKRLRRRPEWITQNSDDPKAVQRAQRDLNDLHLVEEQLIQVIGAQAELIRLLQSDIDTAKGMIRQLTAEQNSFLNLLKK